LNDRAYETPFRAPLFRVTMSAAHFRQFP